MFDFISLITRFYQFYYFYPYTNLYQFTRCATSGSKLKTTFHSTCSTTATRGTLAPFVVRSSTPQQIFPSTWSSTSHRGMSVWSAGKNTTTERVWPNTRKVTSVRLMGRGEVGVRSSVKFETCSMLRNVCFHDSKACWLKIYKYKSTCLFPFKANKCGIFLLYLNIVVYSFWKFKSWLVYIFYKLLKIFSMMFLSFLRTNWILQKTNRSNSCSDVFFRLISF